MTDSGDFQGANPAVVGYNFGLSGESVAAGLRKLADDVQAGRLLPQRVKLEQLGEKDDFHMSIWLLTLIAAQKHQPVPESHDVADLPRATDR